MLIALLIGIIIFAIIFAIINYVPFIPAWLKQIANLIVGLVALLWLIGILFGVDTGITLPARF